MVPVGSVEECERVMDTGWRNRTVGATLMNADSSRSHSIFSIYLEACDTGNLLRAAVILVRSTLLYISKSYLVVLF